MDLDGAQDPFLVALLSDGTALGGGGNVTALQVKGGNYLVIAGGGGGAAIYGQG